MLRQTLQLIVVVAGVAFSLAVPAQQDWTVQSDQRRDAKVVERYTQLLLRNPDHPVAYRGLIGKLGRGPALDRVIERVRVIATNTQRAEPHVLLGHLEHERGRASQSLAAYHRAVALAPDSPTANAALGIGLERAGHLEQSVVHFERALALTHDARAQSRLLRRLCDSALARGNHAQAVRWMQRIAEARPRDFDLRIELAELQLRARQFDAALQSFEAALARAGRNGKRRAETLIDIGNIHRRMHDHVAAEHAYRRALSLIGKSSWMRREALMRLLDVARETGDLASIYDELRREWSRPSYHDAMVLAGVAEELGRNPETIQWLERAIRLNKRAIEPRTRLIARLDHHRDADRVQKLYAEIVALRPADLGQRLERIEWLFLRAGRAEEALQELTRLEQELREDVGAMTNIANVYMSFGLPDAAQRIHEQLEQTAPNHLTHLEAYGELLTRLGRDEAANRVWTRLFAVDTDEVGARLRVAEIAARQKNFDHAIELMEWVVERHPELISARQRLAGTYEAAHRWRAALAQWEALFFDHDVDHARRNILAIANRTAFIGTQNAGPDPEILPRWEARYKSDGRVRTAAVLIQLRRIMGADAQAWALASKIAGQDPTTVPVEDHRAWIEIAYFTVDRATNTRDAIAQLERIAVAFGDQRAIAWRRAVDLAVTMRDGEAVLVRAADALPNDPYIHYVLGAFAASSGDPERGIRHLTRAVELGSKRFEAHFDLALLLKQQNRPNEARAVYLKVIRADWSGDWARSAVFSALDLAETDKHLLEIVAELEGLRGRVKPADFFAIAVTLYGELFLYTDRPDVHFARHAEAAHETLVAAVHRGDADERGQLTRLLALYSPEVTAKLALKLWPSDSKSWSVAMLATLAQTGSSLASEPIRAAFDARDVEVAEMAIFCAGFLRDEQAVRHLIKLLPDPPAHRLHVTILAALGRIGTPDAVDALVARSRKSPADRALAIWALGQGRSRAAAAALSAELTSDDLASTLAGTMLNHGSDEGLRALLRAAWSLDESLRAAGVQGLRSVSDFDVWSDVVFGPELVPHRAIVEALDDAQHPRTGIAARAFVGRERVVVDLTREHLDEAAPQALGFLVEAALEVEESGEADVASSLKSVVRGLRPSLRRLAMRSPVETLAPAVMLLPLAERQQDVDLIARAAVRLPDGLAARALERLTMYPWKSTRQALVRAMKSPEVLRRAAAIRAVARSADISGDREVEELILDLAADTAPEVQVAAIEALGQLRLTESVEMLSELHESSKPIVQQAIRRTLRTLPGERAREVSRRFEVRASLPVCEGDPDDLADLLQDDCAGAVQISDL